MKSNKRGLTEYGKVNQELLEHSVRPGDTRFMVGKALLFCLVETACPSTHLAGSLSLGLSFLIHSISSSIM